MAWGGIGSILFIGGIVGFVMVPDMTNVAATAALVGAAMLARTYVLVTGKSLSGVVIGLLLAVAAWWAFVMGMQMITYVFAGIIAMLVFNQYTRYRERNALRSPDADPRDMAEAVDGLAVATPVGNTGARAAAGTRNVF